MFEWETQSVLKVYFESSMDRVLVLDGACSTLLLRQQAERRGGLYGR